MFRIDPRASGWRGVFLVSITYVYFLIFAQFAFLKRLVSFGLGDTNLKFVMGAMALGGILFSLLAPRMKLWPSPTLRLRVGLFACGAAAALTLFPLGISATIAISFLTGAGLGLLTVTLVTDLRQWTGNRNSLLKVGLGTGIAYFACNYPPFFTATPEVQAATSGLLCIVGIFITVRHTPAPEPEVVALPHSPYTFLGILASLAALVWLDSAAFFIIQNTPSLKTGTWDGAAHLWTNGLLHFAAAMLSVWIIRRLGLSAVLAFSFLTLGGACALLLNPHNVVLASVFYPVGVSLYSVALVAYPSLIAPATTVAERGRMAGWIYAIAGWIGSAMGIGMGQNLRHVPIAFVFVAGAVVLLPYLIKIIRERGRELAATALVLLVAFYVERIVMAVRPSPILTPVERGRQVYISEGCISCHSQYVRPNTADVLLWGPVETLEELRRQHPPLIGNRRQGPDLAEVGGRRSPLWLKAHFYDPLEVSGASIMPSFSFLFSNGRGDDLVAYLESLQGTGTPEHLVAERSWRLSPAAIAEADAANGKRLFQRDCATCHSTTGKTRVKWRSAFKALPTDFSVGPYSYLSPSGEPAQCMDRLAQISKFGIPGTDMPGHEYLPDNEIASLSLWLSQIIAQPNRKQE